MSDEMTFAGVPFADAVRIVEAHKRAQRPVRAEVRDVTWSERLRLFLRRMRGW